MVETAREQVDDVAIIADVFREAFPVLASGELRVDEEKTIHTFEARLKCLAAVSLSIS